MAYPIPDAVLANHTAILGKTGSGKTSTEKLVVEQVVDEGARVCILDMLKSDWWGITSSADGKRPGLPFRILGGPHGHVPIHSSAGKVVGQLVGSGQLPLSIVDMADFEMGGPQKFFVDFAQALMRHQRGVLYLVIEEAHEIAPKERAGFNQENLAIHWAKKLATAGRSKGIRLIVATQRVQALHNAVLGSCETVIAHRLSTPADQDPVVKWLRANADKATAERVQATLSSLPTGTGWLCSGEARIFEQVAFPKFRTYDNTATPTADSEEVKVATAPVDQDELRAIIGEAVKEAEANDPKLLKAEIGRLTRELAVAQRAAQPDPKKAASAQPAWPDQREEVARLRENNASLAQDLDFWKAEAETRMVLIERARAALQANGDEIPAPKSGGDPAPPTSREPRRTPDPPSPAPPRAARSEPGVTARRDGTDAPLNAAAAAIAGLLKGLPDRSAPWADLLVMAGFRPGSGWIRKSRNELLEQGYIVDSGNVVRGTDRLDEEAIISLTTPEPAEIRATWREKLRGPGGQMATWLAENGPATRQRIAEGIGMSPTAGWTRKGFKDLIGSNLARDTGEQLEANPLLVDFP